MKTMTEIVPLLLEWYKKYKRDLPWRQDKDAYHIWISEIMLQQTRVEAVISYYNRFMQEVPNLKALANLEEDQLLKLWQGLGYYSRARNLKKTAEMLVKEGKNTLPSTYESLLQLKGIGSYTAGAIASIAYQERVPAVDGNVLRVMTRILGSYDDIADAKTKTKYEQLLKPIMPQYAPGDFNQALMELGATICIPNGLPRCNICPVASKCTAYQKGLLKDLPVKKKKINRKVIDKTVFLYQYEDTYAIQKRPDTGLLASMYEFPNLDCKFSIEELKEYLKENYIDWIDIIPLGTAIHIFTHLEWNMTGYKILLTEKQNEFIWATKEELKNRYSIPTAFLKIINKK